MKYTIAVGTAFDGISLYGLFDDQSKAVETAETNYRSEQWSVIPIGEIA